MSQAGRETFNTKTSFVAQGSHDFADPVFTFRDVELTPDDRRRCKALNADDVYQVTIEGKRWVCTYLGFHGVHAIFHCPMRNNNIAIWFADLGAMVKRIKQ
jgi:hypothetical protein